jgi:hypothetical protein
MNNLSDFSEPVSLTLEESKSSEVDGEHVLAKVRGPFFFPGGVSRNKRYYPSELWENTLQNEEVKKKLADKTMLGTVYHPQQEPPLEANSHIVTKLWIDPNNRTVGLGEALIINTEKGRALNTLLRLGSKWCVSSRATGKFLPDKNESGMPVVDPSSYILQTFDFTPDPGFVDANPQLVESLLPEYANTDNYSEVNSMLNGDNTSKQMFESLLNEKKSLESTVSDLLSDNEVYSRLGSPEDIAKALDLAKTQGDVLKEYLERGSLEDIDVMSEEYDLLVEALDRYKTLGSVKKIKEVFSRVSSTLAELAEYKKLGDPSEIKEVYVKASKMGDLLEKYQEMGAPKKIRRVFDETLRGLDLISDYKTLGTPEEIEEAFDATKELLKVVNKYKAIGSVSEIQESYKRVMEALEELKKYKETASLDTMKEYVDLGTPENIKETFEKTEEFITYHRQKELEAEAPNMASEFGLSESIVKTVIDAVGDDEDKIRTTLKKMREANKNKVSYFTEERIEASVPALEKTIIRSIADSI